MKVTEVDFSPTLILGPADQGDHTPRSPGLHLSQIYHALEDELSSDSKKRKGVVSLSQLETYRAGGFIWEQALSTGLAMALTTTEWVRPEEFCLDGIAGSPDLIYLPDWTLGESKFTWKSSRHLDAMISGTGPLWVWLVQMKGYCRMMESCRSRLFAYFVNGDYKDGYKPQFRTLDFEFTSTEIRENWDMIKNFARSKKWL